MFIKLLKQFTLVGFLLLVAFISLYVHTSIHTDYIPEEYDVYALVYGEFGQSKDSDKEEPASQLAVKDESQANLVFHIIEKFTPED